MPTEPKTKSGAQDQCPSTRGSKPATKPRVPHTGVGAGRTGRAYWRSLEDLADTGAFREWLEREFQPGASQLLDTSRRTFVKLMGASLALAGAATLPGCRRPDHRIEPYAKEVPEHIIPGRPLFYATAMPLPGGGAEGLLVETHEGRPTKIEGNPLHPINQGRASAWAQASVLDLYDPDRLLAPEFTDYPTSEGEQRTWDDFLALWDRHREAKGIDGAGGRGVAIVVDKHTSPSMDDMRRRLLQAWPEAEWVAYYALDADAPRLGTETAFGRPLRESLSVDRAKVIVSLDRDFLLHEPGALAHVRGYAAGRRVDATGAEMNRLYCVESGFSTTGGKADHRLRLPPSQIASFVVRLADALSHHGVGLPGEIVSAVASAKNAGPTPGDEALTTKWVEALAEDLAAHKGESLVIVGATQPTAVHALVHAINGALGNIGRTVTFREMLADERGAAHEPMRRLARRMASGEIHTVVTLGGNPVFNAPAGSGFAEAFAKVPTRIALSVDRNETVDAANWRLNGTHFLEAWGDVEATDGTRSIVQPMIAPLYAGRSALELVAALIDDRVDGQPADGYAIVRRTWRAALGESGFDKLWRRTLHNGTASNMLSQTPIAPTLGAGRIGATINGMTAHAAPSTTSLEVVFHADRMADGRFANNGWLQELPDPLTHIVWDNVAMMSPATADALGLTQSAEIDKKQTARMCRISIGDATAEVAAWAVPGLPDNTVLFPCGYGRRVVGRVGDGSGFDAFALRASGATTASVGAKVEKLPKRYKISGTSQHGALEGRALYREVDLPAWNTYGDDPFKGRDEHEVEELLTDEYGRTRDLNFAELLPGVAMSHVPANYNSYVNPQRGTKAPPPAVAPENELGETPSFGDPKNPQWGMTIDLSTCTGCNACTIACQAENNIPIVGKVEVNKGRVMHWIRVDRYFVSTGELTEEKNPGRDHPSDPELAMAFQPAACVHCENAPCETVCPVNATVHGPGGTNDMVYNRCIGTRYCANNCPYRVRRFNWFDYGVKKYDGDFFGEETVGVRPDNVNLIPPRLREKLDEISKMQKNPNVTVRSRGVMEKCTYCIQRVNSARFDAKVKNLEGIPDGFFQTACEQSCPAGSIVFGNISDPASRVSKSRGSGRSFLMLGELNTRPRTSYLLSLKNPNPKLRAPEVNPFGHGHGHGGSGGHGAEGPDDDGAPHNDEGGHGGGHASRDARFFDRAKAWADDGYRVSLTVLGGTA